MIRASLEPHLPQLEYHEWERRGHSPWDERFVRDEFFAVLHGWTTRRLAEETADSRSTPSRVALLRHDEEKATERES
jgi:hypothetical protein